MSRKFSVVVNMRSYFSLPDGGPKTYCKRKTLSPFVVDANSCGLMQIIGHIAEHFMWSSKQYVTLYDSSESSGDVSFQIKSDEQVHELFQMNIEKGVVHIDAQINDFDGSLQFSPTKCALHGKVRERMKEKALEIPNTPSIVLDPRIDDPIELTQPTPQKRKTHPTKREAHQKEREPHVPKDKYMMRMQSGSMKRACTQTLILLLH
jgi:hypothetical protein